MNTRTQPISERALVLGGGGSAGNAWLIGVIAGLHDGGLDVTEADLIVGTSAGATAAAQICGSSPTDLLTAILSALPLRPSTGSRGFRPIPSTHLERTDAIIAASADLADMRRRIGADAIELAAAVGAAGREGWRETVGARLPSQEWPPKTVLLTAVDADSGEPGGHATACGSGWASPGPSPCREVRRVLGAMRAAAAYVLSEDRSKVAGPVRGASEGWRRALPETGGCR